jgi:peptidoglycan/LPS O-acetylase OafA/YrhL
MRSSVFMHEKLESYKGFIKSPVAQVEHAGKLKAGNRLSSLDALRGVAILLVIGYHAAYRFPPVSGDLIGKFFRTVGWLGVDVFFALSGYLIVKILIRDAARADIKGFFIRRFFRIVPMYAVAVLLYGAISLYIGSESESIKHLWMTALFLNGWVIPFYGLSAIPFTITWSLSVEEFSYLTLGITAYFSTSFLRSMLVIFLVTALTVRLVVLATNYFESSLLYVFVPARLDAIALGGLGALGAYDALLGRKHCGLIAGLCTMSLMIAFQWTPVTGWFLPAIGYSVFGLFCAIWVTELVSLPERKSNILVKLLAELGKLSYFIYLFHVFVFEGILLVQKSISGVYISFWIAFGVGLFLVCLGAKLSWHYIEYPLIRYAQNSARLASSNVH